VTSKRKKYWSLSRNQCAICAENASFSVNLSGSGSAFSSLAQPSPMSHSSETEPPAYPLNIPYIASCGDIYCYHCISERMIRAAEDGESRWECLRCGELITGAERLLADVEGNETSDYDFSDEELESTSLSGSMGSYVYSESDNGLHS
jgi:peroxin-2